MTYEDLDTKPIDELIDLLDEPARVEAEAARDWAIVLTVFWRTLFAGGVWADDVPQLTRDYQLFMLGPGKE